MSYKTVEIKEYKDISLILEIFQQIYWAKNRSFDEIKSLIDNSSICLGIIDLQTGKLVAFARAVSDLKFISTIVDLVVSKDHREKGLGKRIIKELVSHDTLKHVKQHELYCIDKNIGFYQKLGFNLEKDLNFMRLIIK